MTAGDDTVDVAALQTLIDESFARGGPHLLAIAAPERRLSAAQVVELLAGRYVQVAVATVTARGEPRVAPVDAVFWRGCFHFGTSETSARIRNLRRDPAVSLTWFEGDALAVTVHGTAEPIVHGDPDFAALADRWAEQWNTEPAGPDAGVVYVRVVPRTMLTFDGRSLQPPADSTG